MVVGGGDGVRMCYVGLTAVFSKALEKQPLDKSFCKSLIHYHHTSGKEISYRGCILCFPVMESMPLTCQ